MSNFKLENESKINSGFTIPENYFDDFPTKVIQQLPKNKSTVISIFTKRKKWFYAAVAVIVIALTIPILNNYNTTNASLDQVTIEDYLTYNTDLSEYELAELLDENEIQKMKSEYTIDNNSIEEILSTNSNFEEYLID